MPVLVVRGLVISAFYFTNIIFSLSAYYAVYVPFYLDYDIVFLRVH